MDSSTRDRNVQHVVQRFGAPVATFLENCGLRINRLEFLNTTDLALNLALAPTHKQRLGLTSDELLLLLLANNSQFQWFHGQIRRRIREHERLDRTAALIFSNDPDIRQKCVEARPDPDTGYRTTLVAIGLSEVRRPQIGFPLLEKAFHEQAFAVDHFDCRIPVTGDDLFGRRQLVTQIENDLRIDGRPTGLFGLRRVGKSSVLRQVLSQLRSSTTPTFAIAVADLQRDSYNVTADRIANALYRDLARFAEEIGAKFRNSTGSGFDRLASIVRHLVNKGHRVILAIDEIEWLVPTDPDDATRGKEFLSVMGSLRGLKHEHDAKVGLIVCGINESLAEMGTILRFPNPALDFFSSRYVAGLARSDFDEMLRAIGHRMGVTFAPNFLFEAFKQFGGHPYFSRQFCSMVTSGTKRPLLVSDDAFATHYEQFLHDKRALLAQVMDYFQHFYPREYAALGAIATGSARRVAMNEVKHLQCYGLVAASDSTLQIKVDAVKRWLQMQRQEAVASAGAGLPKRFEVIQLLGEGATARVYRVRDAVLDEERALKVYFDGVDAAAIRAELAILRTVRSPYVVGAYDVVLGDTGQLCLVMEYVPGRSLEAALRSKGSLSLESVSRLSEELFDAIDSIHPDFERIEQLAQLPEQSEEDIREYLKLRDEGHLHRDIKPSNIMVEDEDQWRCRLVDLGLTRPIAAVGNTRVGTEAYAPPDWGGSRWDASFDLYAIAVILYRAMYGVLPIRDSAGQLTPPRDRSSATVAHMWSFFQKGLAGTSPERFRHVSDMRRSFRSCIEQARKDA